tara:strand:+ start:426 stop:1490 length:1065 start_codon:yes stop_codon:yes gene_type:complete
MRMALEEEIRKSVRAHLNLSDTEQLCLMSVAGSGIGVNEQVIVEMISAIIREAPSELTKLVDAKLSQGDVPIRVFIDLGIRLSGLEIDADIRVVPPSPESWWADDVAFDDPRPLGTNRASRLMLETKIPFTILEERAENLSTWHDGHKAHLRIAFDRLQSAFLAIGLCRPLPVPATYNTPTTQHLSWGAELFSSSSLGIQNRPETSHIKLTPNEQEAAINLYHQIYSSAPDWREQFWIPITRLMSASRDHFNPLDLVDLRTALEAFFVEEDERGISHSLALRFARLEGETLDQRKMICKSVKDIYRWTSQAVHRGKIDKKFCPDKTRNIIQIFRNRLVQTIGKERPVWRDFDLS